MTEVSHSQQTSKFHVTALDATGKKKEKDYDILILATPMNVWSSIKFSGIPSQSLPKVHKYIRRYTYFFSGTPNATFVGEANANELPTVILTCGKTYKLSSFGSELPVDYKRGDRPAPVYKIFTNEPLTESEKQQIFPSYDAVELVDWTGAYPVYSSSEVTSSFELMPHLYHVNVIEMAASAMEMSAIAGRNVALLAKTRWNNEFLLIDPAHLLEPTASPTVTDEL